MKPRVMVAGHALHAQLIVFPLGLLGTSPLWDILRLTTGNAMWGAISYWTIVAGVVTALVAAVPGLLDYLAIPRGTRARVVGTWHMVLNLLIVGLFAVSLAMRASGDRSYADAGLGAMIPGFVAVALAVVSGWLGGELVETLGIGVHDGAHPDAPSSLRAGDASSGRPAARGAGPAPARS